MTDYSSSEPIFASEGPLAKVLDGYIYREEQVRFARAVGDALQDEHFLVAEAGTGVGKTYGYLVPALLWALQNREKVVVSTKTKALQQQIVDRDLPQLAQALDLDLKYVEAKGRENYLCWNKYQRILSGRKALEKDQVEFFQKMMIWAEATRSGDRKELGLSPELMRHWPVVMADRNSCLREKCQYHDKCFRLRMIKSMAKADLIVTNHALLLSDVLVDNHILPEFTSLIIDEAHTFIKETFDRLAFRFSQNEFLHLLGLLHQQERRARKGFLVHLRSQFSQLGTYVDECEKLVEGLRDAAKKLFTGFTKGLALPPQYNFTHILTLDDREQGWMAEILATYAQEFNPGLDLLVQRLDELVRELEGEEESSDLLELVSALQDAGNTLFSILIEELNREQAISWVEFNQGQAMAVCAGGVDTGSLLASQLYGRLKSLVMVSATLAVGGKFDNFIARAGLQEVGREGRLITHLENSPFDYDRQAALYVVQDLPDPSSHSFNPAVFQVLENIFAARGGQTMVLFTSRQQLQEASLALRPFCQKQSLNLLVQHEDGDFATLMDDFVYEDNSILMGVETFWEGIDLRGDVLRCLVIVKLPFRSPSDPYCSAWERHYQTAGQSSFKHFMLPDAALRFKQGVGRLIRSETDRGAVVVLDRRLVDRQYGQVFRTSIPIRNLILIPREHLVGELGRWG
ncbi:MAG TPA: helicase C-terminal domain-containing protein [Syntrophomonadaceae bacterium]|nr:helicase C-terminal domain-containing protein [Syntrophomonadaceae bacterium]